MTQTSINYAQVLYELGISKTVIEETKEEFESTPALLKSLSSPVVAKDSKIRIIEKVFPQEIHNFIKVLCDYHSIGLINEIFAAYEAYCNEKENVLSATLTYVTPPDSEQENKIKDFLLKKFNKEKVELNMVCNPQLIGGFVLVAENREFDQSIIGKVEQLKQRLKR